MPEQNVQIWDSAIEEREHVHVETGLAVLRVRDLNVRVIAAVTEDA